MLVGEGLSSVDNETAGAGPDDVADAPEPHAEPARPARRSQWPGFILLLIGGVLAGAIGYLVAKFDPVTGWFGQPGQEEIAAITAGVDENSVALDGLRDAVAAQTDEIAALGERLATADSRLAALSETAAALDSLEGQAATLAARITDLENRPIPDIGATQDAVAAYERQLTAMREMFAAELARIDEAQQKAEEQLVTAADTGRAAAIRAGLSKLALAAEQGAEMGPVLDELKALDVAIPPELDTFSKGTVSLGELQSAFPAAAREAIEADIRARADAGEIGAVEAFVQLQVGRRSLTPQDGDDADAILSRAEAALAAGNVGQALAELDAMAEPQVPRLAEWRMAANEYQAVRQAIARLADDIEPGATK